MRKTIAATVLFLGTSLAGALPVSALDSQNEALEVVEVGPVRRVLPPSACVARPALVRGGVILPPNPCVPAACVRRPALDVGGIQLPPNPCLETRG